MGEREKGREDKVYKRRTKERERERNALNNEISICYVFFSVESGDALSSYSASPSFDLIMHHRKITEHLSHGDLHLWFNHCGLFPWSFNSPASHGHSAFLSFCLPDCLLFSYLVRAALGKSTSQRPRCRQSN